MRRFFAEMTLPQRRILLVAWLGWVFDIMDAALFNFAKQPMLTQMLGAAEYQRIGPQIEGEIQSVFLLGWALGGLVFGVIADRFGRMRTLVVTVLLYSVFTGLTALCQTPEQVMVARFLTALGIGGEWAAGAALVAEAFRSGGRAPASAILQSAAAFGPWLAALANLALRGQPWQWLFIVGVLPAILCVGLRRASHETPVAPAQTPPPFPLKELFGDPVWRRRAIVAAIVGTVGIAGAGTATYWLPNLVTAASEGLPKADLDVRKSTATILSHFGTLAGVLVVPGLCERFGRRRVIGAFYLLTPLVVAAGIAGGATYERLLLVAPFINFFAVGVSAAFVLWFPELFPTRMRATGAGFAYNVGRVFAIPVPLLTGWATGQFGKSIVAGVLASGLIYVIGLLALPFASESRELTE